MNGEEIHSLRAANNRLEHETHLLRLSKQRAEKELANAREQLETEKQLVKRLRKERSEEVRTLREDETKKYECAISDLRTRSQVELGQSLEQQKLQLERNFRSELTKFVHAKDSQLHRLFNHTQRLKREADKKRTAEIQRISDSYQVQLEKLKQGFQKQLIQLLLELKNKERHIESLRKIANKYASSSSDPKNKKTKKNDDDESFIVSSSSLISSSTNLATTTATTTTTSFYYCNDGSNKGEDGEDDDDDDDSQRNNLHSRPASRSKSYRERRSALQQPYPSSSSAAGKRRHEWRARSMKEIGERQPVDTQQFFYHHHYGGSALETLPEAESEEEGSEGLDASEHENPLVTSCSSQASDENFPLSQDSGSSNALEIRNAGAAIIRCDSSEDQRSKILSLELTIRQLREELRECKDQNELLEFRLLEIEEIGSNASPQAAGNESRKKAHRMRDLMATGSEVTLYHGTEVPTEVTIRGDYDSSSNSHASVAESRSSCSDCSDSLSLQESGIFDSHSVNDDSYAAAGHGPGMAHLSGPPNREDISRELANLTSQIENLVLRFTSDGRNERNSGGDASSTSSRSSAADGSEDGNGGPLVQEPLLSNSNTSSSSSSRSTSNNLRPTTTTNSQSNNIGRSKMKRGQDLSNELKSCRQKMQEFEMRLTQIPDINYVNSLEDKVSLLIQENQRLEEERAEMEEAENDSRHQCQRLEEKIQQLRHKKSLLQRQLGNEKLCIEQLRLRVLQLQQREEDLSSQVVRVEALVQSYEQENFELEESCIEMKCSVQYVINCVPVLIVWYLWSLLKRFQSEAAMKARKRTTQTTATADSACLPFLEYKSEILKRPPRCRPPPPPVPRKHKLLAERMNTEPRLKKLRGDMAAEVDENNGKILLPASPSTIPQNISCETQTCEEFWDLLAKDIIQVQQSQWQKVESVLKNRIETLECDINKFQVDAETQRKQLVSDYEIKLAEQEKILMVNKQYLSEHQILQEKWDCLVAELENFLLSATRQNTGSKYVAVKGNINRNEQSPANNTEQTLLDKKSERMPKGESLVANRIRSLFPGEWKESKNSVTESSETSSPSSSSSTPPMSLTEQVAANSGNANNIDSERFTSQLVLRLQEAFHEQMIKFEQREKQLLDEMESLKLEVDEKLAFSSLSHGSVEPEQVVGCCSSDDDNSQIVYLSEENKRLQIMLSDQEAVLNRAKELEEENDRLSVELLASGTLRKRLEDAHSVEASLRNRIEELEQSEIYVKETVEQLERRERKCLERISQLREEIQFLRNKCCQLQDDLDSKIAREAKYKNEIHTLTNKVNACMQELEEKENLLENNAEVSQSQLSKLRAQLNDVQKQLADAECTNGMLREEVLYLERTVQEAIERGSSTEKLVVTLTSELRSREDAMDTLMNELENQRNDRHQHNHTIENQMCNDLDIFAQNEGGLFGVDRDIKDIAAEIKSCSRESCKSSSKKLTEVSEQLNTLTLMLSGSPDMDRINRDSRGVPELLSRCESDECLSRSLAVGSASGDSRKMVSKTKECSPSSSPTSFSSPSSSSSSSPSPPPPPLPSSPPPPKELAIVSLAKDKNVTQLKIELEDRDAQIVKLRERLSRLGVEICQLEERFKSREEELRDSHLAECSWYSARCQLKNDLIRVLARRLAQLSAPDRHGLFLQNILTEIKHLQSSYPCGYKINENMPIITGAISRKQFISLINNNDLDFTSDTLPLYIEMERERMMKLMENSCEQDDEEGDDHPDLIEQPLGREDPNGNEISENATIVEDLEFRICRRIAEDALLVCWSIPEKYSIEKLDGYEISVNGNLFLRIPKPNRFKAVLYALDLSEPLNLSLRCTGAAAAQLQESTITYIA